MPPPPVKLTEGIADSPERSRIDRQSVIVGGRRITDDIDLTDCRQIAEGKNGVVMSLVDDLDSLYGLRLGADVHGLVDHLDDQIVVLMGEARDGQD